ncbi:MAG: cyclic nucleotide-binding domain-containing protein [Candidatus Margulisiibacteriota bacterium]
MSTERGLLDSLRPLMQSRYKLDDTTFEDVFERTTLISVKEGKPIFKEGTHSEFLYVIADGFADVIKKEKKIATVKKGDLLGEMSLLGVDKSSATVTAATPMSLFKFHKSWFDVLMNRYPEMNTIIVMEALNRRLEQTELPTE